MVIIFIITKTKTHGCRVCPGVWSIYPMKLGMFLREEITPRQTVASVLISKYPSSFSPGKDSTRSQPTAELGSGPAGRIQQTLVPETMMLQG